MHTTTLILATLGAINWGIVALFDFGLVALLFGVDTVLANLVYFVIAASGIYLLGEYLMGYDRSTETVSTDRARRDTPVNAHR